MDQQKKKIEIEDKRAASADDTSAAQMLEEVSPSEDNSAELDWQTRATEYLDLARRKEAELRNALRRGEEDRTNAVSNAIEGLIHDLFPALDALSQAVGAFKDAEGENKLVDGVRSTLKLLQKGLSKHGIEVIGDSGVPFDGHLHQALQVEDGDVNEETVAEVYAEGYRIGDRVLKPALVKVLKPQT